MKKKPVVWLARNMGVYSDTYTIVAGNRLYYSGEGWWRTKRIGGHYRETIVCAGQFEKVAPKSCHLKLGGGPIKIDIKISKVKK